MKGQVCPSTFLYINILLTLAECFWTLAGTFLAFKVPVQKAEFRIRESLVMIGIWPLIFRLQIGTCFIIMNRYPYLR
jgi:uncharacterized membrane protein